MVNTDRAGIAPATGVELNEDVEILDIQKRPMNPKKIQT